MEPQVPVSLTPDERGLLERRARAATSTQRLDPSHRRNAREILGQLCASDATEVRLAPTHRCIRPTRGWSMDRSIGHHRRMSGSMNTEKSTNASTKDPAAPPAAGLLRGSFL